MRRSEIEECADADASRMQARLSYVSIAALPGYTSKRLLARTPSHFLRARAFEPYTPSPAIGGHCIGN